MTLARIRWMKLNLTRDGNRDLIGDVTYRTGKDTALPSAQRRERRARGREDVVPAEATTATADAERASPEPKGFADVFGSIGEQLSTPPAWWSLRTRPRRLRSGFASVGQSMHASDRSPG
jgi:hypothetical protein